MKDLQEILIGVGAGFVIFIALEKIFPSIFGFFDVLALVVIYFALQKGEIWGSILGTSCGLLQDTFSLGVFGVGGLSKTIMGFLTGYFSKKMDLTTPLRNFIFILILLCVNFFLWILLYSFIFSHSLDTRGGIIFLQPLCTALFGNIVFTLIKKFKR